MQSLKRIHIAFSIVSWIISFVLLFLWIVSFPSDGGGGLAIIFVAPFFVSFAFFIINSLLYLILLITKKVSSNSLEYTELHVENTIWYITTLLVFWGYLIFNSNVIAAFMLFFLTLVLYSIPLFALHAIFYPRMTERLKSVNTRKYALPILSFFIVTTVFFQFFLVKFLRYDYAKIDAIAAKYTATLLGRKITDGCKVESMYDADSLPIQTFITGKNEIKMDIAPDLPKSWEQINYDISRVPTRSGYITPPNFPLFIAQLHDYIQNSDTQNALITTRLEGPETLTGSIKHADTVKIVSFYDLPSDQFTNYLVIRSYSEPICNYLQADFLGILDREYQL